MIVKDNSVHLSSFPFISPSNERDLVKLLRKMRMREENERFLALTPSGGLTHSFE